MTRIAFAGRGGGGIKGAAESVCNPGCMKGVFSQKVA